MDLEHKPDAPLFGVVTRISSQKGLDLLLGALPTLLAQGGQLALLGAGDRVLQDAFAEAARTHAGTVGCIFDYDEGLAHLMQAGSDFILVPSRFEPCGLTQLCALRYGATPIVARVGGLADTVIDANEAALTAGVATGLQFAPPIVSQMTYALERAATLYQDAVRHAPAAHQRHARRRFLARPRQALRRALSGDRAGERRRRGGRGVKSGPGAPEPLGVTLTGDGVNVAVFLRPCERGLFLPVRRKRRARDRAHRPGRAHGRCFPRRDRGRCAGARYGFRADGPFEPEHGHRFDVSKLLADPYAARIDRPYKLHPSMFERGVDSGPFAPKAIVAALEPQEPGRQRTPWAQTILYELNLRGFTRLDPAIPEHLRGTFAGLAHPKVDRASRRPRRHQRRDHAGRRLRRRAPSAAARADQRLGLQSGLPRRARSAAGAGRLGGSARRRRTRCMRPGSRSSSTSCSTTAARATNSARRCRFAGSTTPPIIGSFRATPRITSTIWAAAIASRSTAPPSLAMAIDALRRWMVQGGIDGFRFDLATAMGRRDWGFDPHAPLIEAIGQDPVLRSAKLIAEPWDIGPGGYQLGNFPEGWGEWNDRFRDAARRFWRGDAGMRGEIATRIAGSRDIFAHAAAPSTERQFHHRP